MKIYRGIVKGNTVELEESPGTKEGTKAWVLLEEAAQSQNDIIERELRYLTEGFEMGKLLAAQRSELYDV